MLDQQLLPDHTFQAESDRLSVAESNIRPAGSAGGADRAEKRERIGNPQLEQNKEVASNPRAWARLSRCAARTLLSLIAIEDRFASPDPRASSNFPPAFLTSQGTGYGWLRVPASSRAHTSFSVPFIAHVMPVSAFGRQ
jgi:hypothetical protein